MSSWFRVAAWACCINICVLCAPVLALEGGKAERSELVLTVGLRKEDPRFERLQILYSHLFNEIDHDVRLWSVPSARSSLELDSDLMDGECLRIADYELLAPEMIRVKEALAKLRFGMFSNQDRLMGIHSMKELLAWDEEPLTICYPRGVIGLSHALETGFLERKHRLYSAKDSQQCFDMLKARRLDMVFSYVPSGSQEMHDDWMKGDGVQYIGVLAEYDGYIFLKREHASLVPLLEQVIRAKKADRSLTRFWLDTSE